MKKNIIERKSLLKKTSVCLLAGIMGFSSAFAILPFMTNSYSYAVETSSAVDYAKLLDFYKKVSNGEIEGIDKETIKQALEAIKKADAFFNKHSDVIKQLVETFPELDEEKIIEGYKKATKELIDEIMNSGNVAEINKMIKNLNRAYENMEKIVDILYDIRFVSDIKPDIYKKVLEAGNHLFVNSILSDEGIKAMEDLIAEYNKVSNIKGADYGPTGTMQADGQWIRSNNGRWWFNLRSGGYPANQFANINGKIYHFDNKGWMDTGWVYVNKNWYYMDGSGAMTYGWQKVNNKWYFMYKDGHMAHDEYIGSYYVNKSGAWTTDHWVKSNNGKWWYSYKKGGYPYSTFETIGGKRYHFDSKGWMSTGWVYVDNNWYYMDRSGAMTYGWQKVNNKWYFMYNDGHMAHNENIGNYYVNKSGAWTTDHWVKSNNGKWWYSYKEGGYPADCFLEIGSAKYHFDKAGWMSTGWVYDGSDWYYMNGSGAMTYGWQKVHGKWYFMYEDGKMAKNTVVQGYRLNASGAWV